MELIQIKPHTLGVGDKIEILDKKDKIVSIIRVNKDTLNLIVNFEVFAVIKNLDKMVEAINKL